MPEATTPGLIAFWDFIATEQGHRIAHRDPTVTEHTYPVVLRQIGDAQAYTPATWPYREGDAKLVISASCPFGKAVRINQDHVFAEVPCAAFDGTPLDLHGSKVSP